ncbi:MAG TPA: TerB family tellurite resistance protein [Ramlibacter sp.]|jgi:uncharacterized tellurite resistance protein B-like protein|uniref:tellurite resistance TerB family protein n=1 Tax=Ramlibacter sp. TaxID=1917967 RepID=UPI002D3673A6|nr:TerB family tellurite resistance protein [Ramlibacter sp.]HZY20554.1 TerB family tellurite resistance protein [Ramlibacter sp.]
MFRSFRDLFDVLGGASVPAAPDPRSLQLACAVLLVEVMRADPQVSVQERETVLAALRRRFDLGPAELEELVALAEQASRTASDFHQFTSQVNDALDQGQKVAVVETMWRVAYADGELGAHENHVISRIAGLLHVTHGEYIGAKLRAKEAAGL